LRLPPRREHIVCQVVLVVFPPVVRPEEDLDGALRVLDGVRVGSGVWIYEVNGVVDGAGVKPSDSRLR